MNNVTEAAPPVAEANTSSMSRAMDIDALSVSPKWKKRFHLIEKAGGPKMPNFKQLSFGERRQIFPFSVHAFVFGPFFYLYYGMWRKAITITAFIWIFSVAVGFVFGMLGLEKLAFVAGLVISMLYAVRAKADYYRKSVLKDNGWRLWDR